MDKKKKNIKNLIFDAIFAALIILFTFVPYLGYYTIGPISFQIVHIFVLLGAILFGYKKGLLYGFIMGLCSLLKVLTIPAGWFDLLFLNPLNSILPRLLFGLISGIIFDFLRKNVSQKTFNILIYPITFFLSLLHSVLVLSSVYLFSFQEILNNDISYTFVGFIISFVSLGAFLEMLAGCIIIPTLYILIYNKWGYGKVVNSLNTRLTLKEIITYISLIIYPLFLLMIAIFMKG